MLRFVFILILFMTCNAALSHEIKITDLFDREVMIPAKINKVIALGSGTLRLLVYAGAQDIVVGKELYEDELTKDFRPYTYNLSDKYYELPVVSAGGPGVMPDINQIKTLTPDVIFTTTLDKDQIDNLSKLTNSPVVGLTYGAVVHTDLEKIKMSLRLIGYITHTQQRVQYILNKMAMLRKDLYSRSFGQNKKSVFMASIAFKGPRGFGSTEKEHPSCLMLNVTNIADEIIAEPAKNKHIVLEIDTIIKKQPDFIFLDISGKNSLIQNYQKLYSDLTKLNAVEEGKVFSVLPYNLYNSNIENIFITAYYIGKKVYPEQFADVKLESVASDIYNSFLMTNPFDDVASKYEVFRQVIFKESGMKFFKR
ncbi:MAG: hypothetical protein C0602_13395 [Denitrovibrio sp.]|nr:MAG: hypothetical protein C0602_13395 [Denitrovibrio sp.]